MSNELNVRRVVRLMAWLCLAAVAPALAAAEFVLKLPRTETFLVETNLQTRTSALTSGGELPEDLITARYARNTNRVVQFGAEVVVQLVPGTDLKALIAGRPLTLKEAIGSHWLLSAPNARTALSEAQSLATNVSVVEAHPARHLQAAKHWVIAPRPNDALYAKQWYLENRDTNGVSSGLDLNVRGAWALTRGQGVTVAVVDDGIESAHPDLTNRLATNLNHNFYTSGSSGEPASTRQYHGTTVSGIVAAEGNNKIGVSGIAPEARLASYVIFNSFNASASEAGLAKAFLSQNEVIPIQNHSWGNPDLDFFAPSVVESNAINQATQQGRGGRGVIMVRSGGNGRGTNSNSNMDGYANNPRVIAVGGVRSDGRPTIYSSPGANLLVAAPTAESNDDVTGLDLNFPTIATTDRIGTVGFNQSSDPAKFPEYAFDTTGFNGTSASAPMITGVVALMLAANPDLTVGDVQAILVLASRQYGRLDPFVMTNAAGLKVSNNTGFGTPDATFAVRMVRSWIPQPAAITNTYDLRGQWPVPDAGLHVTVSGPDVPLALTSIPATASHSLLPDVASPDFRLADAGLASSNAIPGLNGNIALIQRGVFFFRDKIGNAAASGAQAAIVYNNISATTRIQMALTDFVPIPAVAIDQTSGEALHSLLATNPLVKARIEQESVKLAFVVTNTLSLRHVQLYLEGAHDHYGDLRIVLVSPAGTRSIFTQANVFDLGTYENWTYSSTQHFFEPSAGVWTLYITDQSEQLTGTFTRAKLLLHGVPIADSDNDGLDDAWELAHFGSLKWGPADDPDGDGLTNLYEWMLGTDPAVAEQPLSLDFSVLDAAHYRLSWNAAAGANYSLLQGAGAQSGFQPLTNVPGRFPETEWIISRTNAARFFKLGR